MQGVEGDLVIAAIIIIHVSTLNLEKCIPEKSLRAGQYRHLQPVCMNVHVRMHELINTPYQELCINVPYHLTTRILQTHSYFAVLGILVHACSRPILAFCCIFLLKGLSGSLLFQSRL